MREEERLEAGTSEHYSDPALYDHEYRRRRADVNFYRDLARDLSGGRTLEVLELGCGTGRLMGALLSGGHRVVGLDRSPEMLRAARERLGRGPLRHRRGLLLQADLRTFWLRRRFDLVICGFNTLQHVYRREDVVATFGRVRAHLAPGGRFAFDVMNPDLAWLSRDPLRRWARTRFRHPRTGQPLHYSTNHLYDRVTQVNHINIYYDPVPGMPGPLASTQVVRLAHRMFFPEELLGLVEASGLHVVARYGDFAGAPLSDESEQQIVVCA